jgi:D-alanyl-lipoteichoic acid acyltransferase DltB (MBOAT superfamily)
MRFTDLHYLVFLAVTFVVFRVVRRWRGFSFVWLLGMSLLFYGSWDSRYLVLLAAATLLDFTVGGLIHRTDDERKRRLLLTCSVAGNLGMLGVFKYGDFLLESAELALGVLGMPVNVPRLDVSLPIGISFYSFQTLSYSIDIFRRQLEPRKSLLEFTLFVAYFPQLVAGPIVRAREFLPQLYRRPRLDPGAIGQGLLLISAGLFKKMVLGDGLGRAFVDPFFADPGSRHAVEAIVADWAAYFALYCDFSGYTDVAIGSALLFGFVLPVNFDRPAFAPSPLEHWRRWHITLGTFLRDYLYFPLGGSRVTRVRLWINLFIVFFVSGIWHGVGMSYVLMGLYNGVLAATWRTVRPRPARRGWVLLFERLLSFQLTALSVLALRPISVAELGQAVAAWSHWDVPFTGLIQPSGVLLLVMAVGLHLTPRRWKATLLTESASAPALAVATLVVAVGGLCALFAFGTRDFYYFQF